MAERGVESMDLVYTYPRKMTRIELVERLIALIARSNWERRRLQRLTRGGWADTDACRRLQRWEQDTIAPLLQEYEARRMEGTMTKPETRVRSHGRALNRGHLTDADVVKIRRAFEYGATLKTVADQFHISVPNAWSIRTRRTWKHIS